MNGVHPLSPTHCTATAAERGGEKGEGSNNSSNSDCFRLKIEINEQQCTILLCAVFLLVSPLLLTIVVVGAGSMCPLDSAEFTTTTKEQPRKRRRKRGVHADTHRDTDTHAHRRYVKPPVQRCQRPSRQMHTIRMYKAISIPPSNHRTRLATITCAATSADMKQQDARKG
jgi:hypothetical protein